MLCRAKTNMDPDECVIFAYDGVLDHRDLAIPAPYVHSLCSPLYIMEQVNFKRSESSNQAQHLTSGNSKMTMELDNRNEAKALGIPPGEFQTQQLLETLHRNIGTVTAANCDNCANCANMFK